MGHTADLSTAGSAPAGAAAARRERNFYIALGCAVLLHASLLASAIRVDDPRQLGDPTGAEDAISVSLVTEADLQSRSTVAEPPQAPPAPENQPAPPPQQSAPQPPPPEAQQQPAEPTQPQPEVQQQAAEPQPVTPDQQQTEPAKPEQPQVAKLEDPKSEAHAPDLFSLDDQNPANAKSEDQPKVKPELSKTNPAKSSSQKSSNKAAKSQKKRVANLDLSAPQDALPSFSGRSAGLQRPPGITRSGVNDAFARAVIRALQQTMPQLTNALGRVTVRILLSENGNVVEVRLLAGAKDTTLNQDVVFAAQQTSYPIPPSGSTTADRTFMVTYIYD
jgi:TonB family protein